MSKTSKSNANFKKKMKKKISKISKKKRFLITTQALLTFDEFLHTTPRFENTIQLNCDNCRDHGIINITGIKESSIKKKEGTKKFKWKVYKHRALILLFSLLAVFTMCQEHCTAIRGVKNGLQG